MTDNGNEDEDVFSTRDLTLAAVLITLKFKMTEIEYQIDGIKPTPIGWFIFDNSPALREARQKYTQALLSVEPRAFMMAVHSLKAEVMAAFKSPRNRTF